MANHTQCELTARLATSTAIAFILILTVQGCAGLLPEPPLPKHFSCHPSKFLVLGEFGRAMPKRACRTHPKAKVLRTAHVMGTRLQPLRADVATHEQRLERLARGDNSASTLDRLADTEAELQAARTRLNTATREALVKLDKIARASGWTGPL